MNLVRESSYLGHTSWLVLERPLGRGLRKTEKIGKWSTGQKILGTSVLVQWNLQCRRFVSQRMLRIRSSERDLMSSQTGMWRTLSSGTYTMFGRSSTLRRNIPPPRTEEWAKQSISKAQAAKINNVLRMLVNCYRTTRRHFLEDSTRQIPVTF
jgi:hypothetical protein